MAVLVVSLGIALLLIVVSILLLHISSAGDIVRIRRRLECSECLVLTVLTSGSITMGIYLCLQAGVFLASARMASEVPVEYNSLWYISGFMFVLAFIGHILALGTSLVYHNLTKKRVSHNLLTGPVKSFEHEEVLPNLKEGRAKTFSKLETSTVDKCDVVNTFSSATAKPTFVLPTSDTTNILLLAEGGIEPIPVKESKQCSSSISQTDSESNVTSMEIFLHFLSFVFTSCCVLFVVGFVYTTEAGALMIWPSCLSFISNQLRSFCISLGVLVLISVILIVGFAGLGFSARVTHHLFCSSLLTLFSVFVDSMWGFDCHLLLITLTSSSVFVTTLTVWCAATETIMRYSLQRGISISIARKSNTSL
jgi:hypothetical protein